MRAAKKLLLVAILTLTSAQQCHALKSLVESVEKNVLLRALKKGDITLVKLLFSVIDPDRLPIKRWREPLSDGNLLLHQTLRKAINNKSYYQCIELFQKKIDPHCCFGSHVYRKDIHGEYPLDIAFKQKLSKIAIFLINLDQSNCCFNKRNDDYTLLHYATESRLFEVITYLIKDFESQSGHPGYLANSQPQDSDGWTALHYASAKGDYKMCKFLLALGFRPDIKNNDNKTALELWPENYRRDYCDRLVDMVRMRTRAPRCSTEDRYLYLKKLETFAKKSTRPDIKIYCKK